MDNIKKALEALDLAIKNCDTVKSVVVKITLQKPKPSKAKHRSE